MITSSNGQKILWQNMKITKHSMKERVTFRHTLKLEDEFVTKRHPLKKEILSLLYYFFTHFSASHHKKAHPPGAFPFLGVI